PRAGCLRLHPLLGDLSVFRGDCQGRRAALIRCVRRLFRAVPGREDRCGLAEGRRRISVLPFKSICDRFLHAPWLPKDTFVLHAIWSWPIRVLDFSQTIMPCELPSLGWMRASSPKATSLIASGKCRSRWRDAGYRRARQRGCWLSWDEVNGLRRMHWSK